MEKRSWVPIQGNSGSPSEHGLTGNEQSLKDQPSKASLMTVKAECRWLSESVSGGALATFV